MEASSRLLGAPWEPPGVSWRPLGGLLGASWGPLGGLLGVLEVDLMLSMILKRLELPEGPS